MTNKKLYHIPQHLDNNIPSSGNKNVSNPILSPEIVARTDFGAPKNKGPIGIHV